MKGQQKIITLLTGRLNTAIKKGDQNKIKETLAAINKIAGVKQIAKNN